MKIVIYTPKVTNRISYILDFVFSSYFGVLYQLEIDIEVFKSLMNDDSVVCINYSNINIQHSFSIPQDDLLLESTITKQHLFISKIENIPVLFPTDEPHKSLGFDIFSAIFYLISRYEEYLPHEKDNYDRYCSSNSILANPVFNFKPIVEIWLLYLKQELFIYNPRLSFKQHQFTKIFTFDIDHAFQTHGRDWLKNPPNFFNPAVLKTLFLGKKDAFDTFDWIWNFCNQTTSQCCFFFLMNDDDLINSKVQPSATILHELINRFKEHTIGIHPSFYFTEQNLIKEKKLLENVIDRKVEYSRQHYLKINFPTYYNVLSNQLIKIDFSLAYPDVSGCRAGTTQSFYFFDLHKNEKTSLLLQPFVFMDATYQYYKTKEIESIQHLVEKQLEQIKNIQGNFVSLFHNNLLIDKFAYNKILYLIENYK